MDGKPEHGDTSPALPMIPAAIRESTLDALTEGRDIADYRDEARAFLSDLMNETPLATYGTVVPVARRLLAYPDWRETMTVQSVRDYCVPRAATINELNSMRTDDYDPAAEHLNGIVECYRDSIGRPTFLVYRPDLVERPDATDSCAV